VSAEVLVRTSEPPRLRLVPRLQELWRSREILANLSRKELRVRYKSSVLGILWSMLNPVLYLVIFSLVFVVILRGGVDYYPILLLSGLLPWTLFSTGWLGATGSVTGNAQLVPKVAFAREVLPLAAIRAQTVNFFFQFAVLLVFLLVLFGLSFVSPALLLVPAALVVLLLFIAAVGLFTAALNVRYRDTGHLVELALLAWFWSTPIVYPARVAARSLGETGFTLYLLNPLANVVLAFQRALYGAAVRDDAEAKVLPTMDPSWYWTRLGLVAAGTLVLLYLAWRLFFRMSGDFAEEL
jgi:ABC-2 type transport system permease protein